MVNPEHLRNLQESSAGGSDRAKLPLAQNSEYHFLRQAGDFDRLDFIARKHLGGVAGIPDIDAERPEPFCAAQSIRRPTIRAAQKHQQSLDLVSLGKLDLVEGQQGFQVLLDRLLAMEADDFAKADAARHTWRQLLGGFEIGFGLLDLLAQQGLEVRIKRLHR